MKKFEAGHYYCASAPGPDPIYIVRRTKKLAIIAHSEYSIAIWSKGTRIHTDEAGVEFIQDPTQRGTDFEDDFTFRADLDYDELFTD